MRKFDRIEKELGYCEVKLEKKRRLKKQRDYLQADIEALDEVLTSCREEGVEEWYHSMYFAEIPIIEIPEIMRSGIKKTQQRVKKAFMTLGSYIILNDERDIFKNELDDINNRLEALADFDSQHNELERQRKRVLKELGFKNGKKNSWTSLNEFDMVEHGWHSISEDLANVEIAVHHMGLNLDCLKSGSDYMLSAVNLFDIQKWICRGTFADLVIHSPVGRAYEMVHGADVNLTLAEKEVLSVKVSLPPIYRSFTILGPFLHSLFNDLFIHFNFHETRNVFDEFERKNRSFFNQLKKLQDKLETGKFSMEQQREEKYNEVGEEVKHYVFT